ncbi:DoxX family membrane protein [Natronococcus sp. JC468]|uniref:DoxX family membrane protein n=1 Tax=Natronococcus sp. JC468 TaxID=1961921 RepID=UPI00143B55F2|nr:DoxX family membrane protein [Natronococcus sp. JC468]NKE37023.1 DoxX family membrane protein [Natronococcus sp. JC468]
MSQIRFGSRIDDSEINLRTDTIRSLFAVILRLLIGYVFFIAGWEKLTAADPFDAGGYLSGAASAGSPAAGVFDWMSATPLAVEFVNVAIPWGELLVGLGLLVGAFTRLAAAWGAFMMGMVYLGNWTVSSGVVVTREFEYLIVVLSVAAFSAGRVFGADAYLERLDVVQRHPWLRSVLG